MWSRLPPLEELDRQARAAGFVGAYDEAPEPLTVARVLRDTAGVFGFAVGMAGVAMLVAAAWAVQ